MAKWFTLITLLTFSLISYANNWNANYVEIKQGSHYKLSKKDRMMFRYTHSSSWLYGENDLFFEVINPINDETNTFAKYDTAISLSKITKRNFGIYPIIDTLPAATFYWDEMNRREYSFGSYFYLDPPPYVKYTKLGIFWRKDATVDSGTYAITLNTNLKLGHDLTTNFGLDLTPRNQAGKKRNFYGKIDLMYDIGQLLNCRDNVFAGFGLSYWKNKLGVSGVNERAFFGYIRMYL